MDLDVVRQQSDRITELQKHVIYLSSVVEILVDEIKDLKIKNISIKNYIDYFDITIEKYKNNLLVKGFTTPYKNNLRKLGRNV